MLVVLDAVHEGPVRVSSNYARAHAPGVAAAASLGLITTRAGEGYGRTWRCTAAGLDQLERTQK